MIIIKKWSFDPWCLFNECSTYLGLVDADESKLQKNGSNNVQARPY